MVMKLSKAARSAALRFKVLADPNRLAIFEMLRAGCDCARGGARRSLSAAAAERTVGEIAARLGIGVPTVSHHLKELWRAGLIRHERRGQRVYCSIDEAAVVEITRFFSSGGHGS
jgi:ArsR family transcriptional regulator, arsenate/arsenite/antimonite-responsive transcriptional repressor